MVHELTNRQILAASSQGISPELIAKELDLDLATVNLVLAAHNQGDRDINDNQLAILRQNAFDLACQREDISVAARMTTFLIERDKPRSQVSASPMIVINNAIAAASQRFDELAKGYTEDKIIPLNQ